MGGRLLRAVAVRPLVALARIQDRLDAVEDFAFRRDRARQAARRCSRACTTSSGWWRASRSARPARATWWRSASRSRSCRALRTVAADLQAPLVRQPARRNRRPGGRPRRDRRDARGRAAGRRARWRRDPRRRRRGARRAARDQPRRQGRDRGDGRGRAGAHRHQLAEDPLQPRLRLLHRDLQVEPGERAAPTTSASRRSPAASASSRRRSRSTRTRSSAPTSASRCASWSCSKRCALRVAAEAPRVLDTARAVAALDVLAALADTAVGRQLHQAAGARRRRVRCRRCPPSDRRAPRRAARSCRTTCTLDGSAPAARDPHRAEHGRQVHVPAAGRRCSRSWRRSARSCRRASAKLVDRRSHLRARRRVRQHRARPVHVHGRDAGDRHHPAHGDVSAAW